MPWFGRSRSRAGDEQVAAPALARPAAVEELPLIPASQQLTPELNERIVVGLAEAEADGVDVDDLASIGTRFDAALAGWMERSEGAPSDHDAIVERYAIAIGEHLSRRTDLRWGVVVDVFGTDLGLSAGSFVVVPSNLVASRWMRRETGWIPGVVGHLIAIRT